eukprot:1090849-Pleurochrysis_carterae.AAC.2
MALAASPTASSGSCMDSCACGKSSQTPGLHSPAFSGASWGTGARSGTQPSGRANPIESKRSKVFRRDEGIV